MYLLAAQLGKPEEALRVSEQIEATMAQTEGHNRTFPEAEWRNTLGITYIQLGRLEEATVELGRAAEIY
jgi:Flp pilus assembly protein TadD